MFPDFTIFTNRQTSCVRKFPCNTRRACWYCCLVICGSDRTGDTIGCSSAELGGAGGAVKTNVNPGNVVVLPRQTVTAYGQPGLVSVATLITGCTVNFSRLRLVCSKSTIKASGQAGCVSKRTDPAISTSCQFCITCIFTLITIRAIDRSENTG